ncbi:GDSL-type esterase/lipase family protein [Actinopolymorpha pittospori]|uniref:Lysophospholipase L1-like esterase n=1 Tax=Actinopolymorpha pittospori TaxID=648752 RepID=A0A927REA2_9ACTN|nr:lysophospholipase L1-like esterase [Actinopolymorpha pittospori]
MGKARAARKLAAAAALGGGGAGLLGGTLVAILFAEAILAKRTIGEPAGQAPVADGLYGEGPGEPISFVVLGDSTACGLGVDSADETPGGLLAAGLAALSGRPVRLSVAAISGAETQHLDDQVDQVLMAEPDVALVIIGANDVTHRTLPTDSVRLLVQGVRRLREASCEVVVGTCPDLGTVEPLAFPLRQLARVWSRRLAAAQTIAVVETGARTVSLGSLLGPEFAAAPHELFGPDRFHPSAAGYASAAVALLPSLAAAIGYWPEEEDADVPLGEGQILPISYAAVRAAKSSGTEVAGTDVAGHERGPRGRWALLRRHGRREVALPDQLSAG